MEKYEALTLHLASCGLYSYKEVGEPYRKKYIDPILKEMGISIEQFNKDIDKANDKIMEGMKTDMKEREEKYRDMANWVAIKKISEGEYTLVSKKDGAWVINKTVPYEEAVKRLEVYKKRLDLLAKGFEYIPNINLMNGFERHEEMLHKIIDGIDVYIVRRKRNEWGIVGHRREIGKDCVCDVFSNDFTKITDEMIDNIVKSVKETASDYRREIINKIDRGEE